MIKRSITPHLNKVAKQFRVVAILGPRQSGKTTLAQETFKKHTYLSFEDLDVRKYAQEDPRDFLDSHKNKHGIIIDEFQHVPDILSYIQTWVDREKQPGYFILTGSQNFLMNEKISQSLAGRIAIITLLPLSLQELKQAKLLPDKIENVIFNGGYPSIYADKVDPELWYPNYLKTYIERDVRQIKNVTNLSQFQTFLGLCAGRMGQLLNMTSLADDCGITVNTVKSWLSILEASYIIYLLRPHHKNFSKRLVKMPKLYFYDTGLACHLLDITEPKQWSKHFLKGGLMEAFVISDFYKQYYNKLKTPRLYFWRDHKNHEVDCLIQKGEELIPIEIKSGKTISSSYFDGLKFWNKTTSANPANNFVVYSGDEKQKRSQGNVRGWQLIDEVL